VKAAVHTKQGLAVGAIILLNTLAARLHIAEALVQVPIEEGRKNWQCGC
jgi:hypothetical protein